MEMKSCAFQRLGRNITSHECLSVYLHDHFSNLVALKAWLGLLLDRFILLVFIEHISLELKWNIEIKPKILFTQIF